MVIQKDPARKRVAILTFSEVTRDPRIRRAAEFMVSRGHEVRVYTFQFESVQAVQDYAGFQVFRLPLTRFDKFEISLFCKAMGDLAVVIDFLWPDLLKNPFLLQVLLTRVMKAARKRMNPATIKFALQSVQNFREALVNPGNYFPGVARNWLPLGNLNIQRDLYETQRHLQLNLELFRAVGSWATHIYANDLETLSAGVMLKRAYDACLIYDAHEIWPHQWSVDYRSAQFLGFFSTLERLLIRETDQRITVGEGLASYFKFAYACEPFTVIPNTPSIKHLVNETVLQRRSEKRGLLYHGIYTAFRGLEEIIVVEPLIDDSRVAFRGIGNHERLLRSLANEQGSKRIEFLPPVPVDDLVQCASEFDIGLLPFVNSCLNTNYAFPNKLFEYMMAGLAIAATDLIDQRRIVMQHQMGVVFDIHDREQVAERLNYLLRTPDVLDEMRRNAWIAARDIYNWENSSIEFGKALANCGL